jgi:hypothetical protein
MTNGSPSRGVRKAAAFARLLIREARRTLLRVRDIMTVQ